MKLKYNHPILKQRRQGLRRRQTEAEAILWNLLRNRQLSNFKFYRQYSVGPYILDFFCPKKRLAVELDGIHHTTRDNKNYDKERDAYLESEGIEILRLRNDEVLKKV